jgi:DNA-binding LacI/PurR family transcriptional regulator
MQEDIRAKGMRAGEPYLTTAQAGRQLGITKSMAYRAMKILIDRQVLVTHLGRGMFVGPSAAGETYEAVKCCHVFMTRDMFKSSGQATHDWVAGLTAALADHNVQFNFIAAPHAELRVRRILEQGLSSGSLSCAALIGCPLEVQEEVLRSRVPALVFGSDYSTTSDLPSLDADQFEAGRLAANYLLGRGRKRIALLMREIWFPGDRRMFEGVGRALDDERLGHDALMLRNVAVEPTVLAVELRRLLTQDHPPTGCLCRSPLFAEVALEVALSLGLEVPGDLNIVDVGLYRRAVSHLRLPFVSTKVDIERMAFEGGQMLARMLAGQPPDPLHVVMPVELIAGDTEVKPLITRRGKRPSAKKTK